MSSTPKRARLTVDPEQDYASEPLQHLNSPRALEHLSIAKDRFLRVATNKTLSSPLASKASIPLLEPNIHLTANTWKLFREFVSSHEGWTATRVACSDQEKQRLQLTRNGKVYRVSVQYQPDVASLKTHSQQKKARLGDSTNRPIAPRIEPTALFPSASYYFVPVQQHTLTVPAYEANPTAAPCTDQDQPSSAVTQNYRYGDIVLYTSDPGQIMNQTGLVVATDHIQNMVTITSTSHGGRETVPKEQVVLWKPRPPTP